MPAVRVHEIDFRVPFFALEGVPADGGAEFLDALAQQRLAHIAGRAQRDGTILLVQLRDGPLRSADGNYRADSHFIRSLAPRVLNQD